MSLDNHEFLTSKEFAKKGLSKVIHKYRNGGAHDSPISEEVCRECIEVIIGNPTAPGYLSRLVAIS